VALPTTTWTALPRQLRLNGHGVGANRADWGADGHAVFHAYDGRSAVELVYALRKCDLVISNTKVDGMPGIDLIRQLRQDRPSQPILYIANIGRSSPEIEAQPPTDVPIIREPFTAEQLRKAVGALLDGMGRERSHSN
jgi:CheY-like chemotaxis protein